MLEPTRAEFGQPIKITSGYRPSKDNRRVGGVGDSQHLDGSACDFVVLDIPGPVVYAFLCDKMRFPGEVLYYKKRGHVHVALPRFGTVSDHLVLDK